MNSFFPHNSPFPVVEINKNQCRSSDFGALCSQLWSNCLQAKEPVVRPHEELSWYGNKEKHWHKKNVNWFALELTSQFTAAEGQMLRIRGTNTVPDEMKISCQISAQVRQLGFISTF